jgi:cyclohexa-1,5-dienecarbonyl-CoA hydratase
MSDNPLKVWLERDGKLLRLRLARPKANIIDAEMIAALERAFAEHAETASLNAVLLDHEGPHFSFGASVEEHLPGQCAAMLKGLHRLIGRMLDCRLPILTALKGQCLGGGLEVVAATNLIFAHPEASLGQPEIKLAVFAPAASCLLPERIGRARAEDLLFSGRSISGTEARDWGLAVETAEDPEAAALAYFDRHLAGLSGSSLGFAKAAVGGNQAARVKAKLAEVEALYLEGLMQTEDAVEGLEAFIEKRTPTWGNR